MSARKQQGKQPSEEVKEKESPDGDLQKKSPDGDNVDRIRDIIFGTQMRDYESRFRALEERLGNTVDALRDQMIEGLNGIRSTLSSEVDQLSGQIQTENSDRSAGLSQAANQLAGVQQSIHQRLEEQNRGTAEGLKELEKAFDNTAKELSTTFENRIVDLTKLLEKQVAALRADKTDRSALADLLNQLATRLRDES